MPAKVRWQCLDESAMRSPSKLNIHFWGGSPVKDMLQTLFSGATVVVSFMALYLIIAFALEILLAIHAKSPGDRRMG